MFKEIFSLFYDALVLNMFLKLDKTTSEPFIIGMFLKHVPLRAQEGGCESKTRPEFLFSQVGNPTQIRQSDTIFSLLKTCVQFQGPITITLMQYTHLPLPFMVCCRTNYITYKNMVFNLCFTSVQTLGWPQSREINMAINCTTSYSIVA
jgi:hypothetical protein